MKVTKEQLDDAVAKYEHSVKYGKNKSKQLRLRKKAAKLLKEWYMDGFSEC